MLVSVFQQMVKAEVKLGCLQSFPTLFSETATPTKAAVHHLARLAGHQAPAHPPVSASPSL